MQRDFLIIAVTPPDFFPGEAHRITQILSDKEAHFVHIRKPGSAIGDMEELISTIPPEFHNHLKIHDHFNLIEKYDLGGCHLNGRNPLPHPMARSVSKSIHSLEEIPVAESLDYFFISPVFDSISKQGYKSTFDLDELSLMIKYKNGIALGGVTPEKFPLLVSLGFKGAAMLGYFFPQRL